MQPSSSDRRPTTNDQRPTPGNGLWALDPEPSGTPSGARLPGATPSAWDNPAEEEAPEAGESAALQEWYRYIDSLARPSRRGEAEDDEPEATPLSWGLPWTPPLPADLDEEAAGEIVAQLAPEAAPEASVDWQPSGSDVAVPDFTEFIPVQPGAPPPAPPFDVAQVTAPPRPEPLRAESVIPSSAAASTPAAAPTPPQTSALVPVSAVRVTEVVVRPVRDRAARERPAPQTARPATPAEQPAAAPVDSLPTINEIRQRLPRHMERLLQVPTTEVAQHSYKSPFKETREELIHRLLDPCLTLEEAARLLGVCPTTVRRYTNRGLLRHQRTVGNQRRFRLSHVLEFLDEHGGTWRMDVAEEERAAEAARRSADGRTGTVH